MLTDDANAKLETELRERLSSELSRSNPGDSRLFLEIVVEGLARAITQSGSRILLALEIDPAKPATSNICGLIVWDGKQARVIPMTVTALLVRIDGKPFFLGYEEAAVDLKNALLSHVEALPLHAEPTRS